MEFNIYAAEDLSGDDFLKRENLVESGLSPGEMRQSLLDRLRVEIEDGNIEDVNDNLAEFDLFIIKKHLYKKGGEAQAIQDVENVLYAAPDEQFNGSEWFFTGEEVYVLGEED